MGNDVIISNNMDMIPRYGNASKYTFIILYWYVDRGIWLSGFWRIALCSDLCIMFTLIKSDKIRLCCATWSYGLLTKCSNIYQISWPAEPASCQIYHIYMYIPFLGEVQYHLAVSSKLLDVLEKISREMEREHGKERRRPCILLWRERQMCISAHR